MELTRRDLLALMLASKVLPACDDHAAPTYELRESEPKRRVAHQLRDGGFNPAVAARWKRRRRLP